MLDRLFQIIEQRKQVESPDSYTQSLFNAGEDTILRKISEETTEVLLAAKSEGNQRLIEESADLIYHLFVLLSYKNLTLDQLIDELTSRDSTKP